MQEDQVHVHPTRADYIDYVNRTLQSIESSLVALQQQLHEVQGIVTLLADLESTDSSQETDSATGAPVIASPPAVPSVPESTVPQPTLRAIKLSKREQLALARQRARDWAARELNRTRRNHPI